MLFIASMNLVIKLKINFQKLNVGLNIMLRVNEIREKIRAHLDTIPNRKTNHKDK